MSAGRSAEADDFALEGRLQLDRAAGMGGGDLLLDPGLPFRHLTEDRRLLAFDPSQLGCSGLRRMLDGPAART
jgi:hypothetical protein